MATQGQTLSSWVTQPAVTIALITATVYFCIIALQSGYNKYFNIPPELISLNPATVFSLSLPLFLLFVILFGLLAAVFYFIAGIISLWTGSFSTLLESILRQGAEVTKPLMLTFESFFKAFFVVYSYFMVNTLLVVFSNYLGKNWAKHKKRFSCS